MTFSGLLYLIPVLIAFGFVIFWHELGHFLAARWAGVRAEQFAVGMGQAVVSWRKGIGFKFAGFGKGGWHWGSTQEEFDRRIDEEWARRHSSMASDAELAQLSLRERYDIAADLGMGETEYRLSWIPLGGYVKPTGQDDLRPAREVAAGDPKSFGAKSVGKRMVIISAGVVMNVILAFALYILLFMIGFNAPPAIVGNVIPGSPAHVAGLKVGDRIVRINGHKQEDFTKIRMDVSLLGEAEAAKFEVVRDGQSITLPITPVKTAMNYDMPAIGVSDPTALEGAEMPAGDRMISPLFAALPAGARIVAVNGRPTGREDIAILDNAVQSAKGRPVDLTIEHNGVQSKMSPVPGLIMGQWSATDPIARSNIAGLQPRVRIGAVREGSAAQAAGLKAGDVLQQIAVVGTGEILRPPAVEELLAWIQNVAKGGDKKLQIVVERDGRPQPPIEIDQATLTKAKKVLGIALEYDSGTAEIARVVDGAPAAAAGVSKGDRVVAVGERSVASWYDVVNVLQARSAGDITLTLERDGKRRDATFALGEADLQQINNLRYALDLPLAPLIHERQTFNPITAAVWGYEETKQSIFNVYRTIRSLFMRTVPLSNLSGPLGIFNAGTAAAKRGPDWLIWFMALISANLAVVNFLPIPIVDGGLFIFLLAEKITGRPPSPRVQAIAQMVGIALLGSLFLYATYHDLLRAFG